MSVASLWMMWAVVAALLLALGLFSSRDILRIFFGVVALGWWLIGGALVLSLLTFLTFVAGQA